MAVITQYADDEDCENNDISEDRDILVWICAREKSQSDREVTETITIELDASDSTSGDETSQYIPRTVMHGILISAKTMTTTATSKTTTTLSDKPCSGPM